VNGKSVLATVLAACYAGACVGSLWNRSDAIFSFALVRPRRSGSSPRRWPGDSLPGSFWAVSPQPWVSVCRATAVIYTVGYPFYLALFFLTFVFGGGDYSPADS
jgi:hypothetical protein